MKSAGVHRDRNKARTPVPSKESTPRRPWPLILLGAVGLALVLTVGFDRKHRVDSPTRPEQRVYSAAADTLVPMAVSSRQTGKLEPPGVASPLHLFAVTPGRNNREGIAVLGPDEESSRTYVAGALFENGARLTEFYADRVVLARGPKNYTLYLRRNGRSDQLGKPDTEGLTVGTFSAPQPPLTSPSARVSDVVRVAPVYDGTQIAGYSVYPGSRTAQFERWGFKAGDVLVNVGGQPLTSSEEMNAFIDQLEQGVTLTGEVRRGEERVAVTLDGSAL